MSGLYSSSEMQAWSKNDLIEEIISQQDIIEILKQRCITGNYENKFPVYRQGIPEHELEDYALADELNYFIKQVTDYETKSKESQRT